MSAAPAPGSGCDFTITSGATLSWYPGTPGSMSQYRAACVFRNDTGNNQVSPSYTLHDQRFAVWHNGASRKVTVNAAPPASTVLTANPTIVGTGLGGYVNRTISGPGIAPRTHVISIVGDTITLSQPTAGAIAPTDVLSIENAPAARSVGDATSPAANTISSPSANFVASDIGHSIGGTGIPAGSTITAVGGGPFPAPTTATVSGAFAAGSVTGVVSVGGALNYSFSGAPYGPAGVVVSTARQVTGAVATNANTINSAQAGFEPSDIGMRVIFEACDDGLALPADQFITAVAAPNATVAPGTINAGAGFPRTCDIVIGEPSGNAPDDGQVVTNQAVQLNLNPTLVAGTDACGNDTPEGFAITGIWRNPGNFFTGVGPVPGAPNKQPGFGTVAGINHPANVTSKAIGQILIDTSAADYSIFIMERNPSHPAPNGVTGSYPAGVDPIGPKHYDILVPFAPTGLALCPGSATSPGLAFSLSMAAISFSQSTAEQGTGRPGTGQVRNIVTRPTATWGYNGTTFATSDAAAAGPQWTPAGSGGPYARLCAYPNTYPSIINFQCGPG